MPNTALPIEVIGNTTIKQMFVAVLVQIFVLLIGMPDLKMKSLIANDKLPIFLIKVGEFDLVIHQNVVGAVFVPSSK